MISQQALSIFSIHISKIQIDVAIETHNGRVIRLAVKVLLIAEGVKDFLIKDNEIIKHPIHRNAHVFNSELY